MNDKNNVVNMQMSDNDNTVVENDLVFYGTKDVARVLDCSVPTAREIMRRHDFPLIMVGKNMRVLKTALEQWAMERRVNKRC